MSTPNVMETEDGRFYVLFAGTDREERFRSVTAPLSRWDKDDLKTWAGLLAGRGAFDEIVALNQALTTPDCGRTYHPGCDMHGWDVSCPDCRCKKCEPCMVRWMRDRHMAESKRRTDEGTRIHEIVNHWAATGIWLVPDPDIKVYIDSFRAFVKEYGIRPEDYELLEARVINRTHGYAGTLDAAVHIFRDRTQASFDLMDRITGDAETRLDQALVLVDYKSREKPERAVYMDQSLQLAGYRYGETLILKDGTEIPMFAVDATAIIQIRPDKTTVELMLTEEPEFEAFLALLDADLWALERGKRAIGARTFSYGPAVKRMRERESRQRTAQRKKAAAELAKQHTPVDDYTCGCGHEVDGFTAPEIAREKLYETHITPVAGVPMPQPAAQQEAAPADTPAERGKRAAAAARRGVHPALAEMAQDSGKAVGRPTVVPHGERYPVGLAQTVTVPLLGAPVHHGADDEIPF